MRRSQAQVALLVSLLLQCLVVGSSVAQDETDVESTIDRVTVFTSGARVTRKATAQIPAGTTLLVFSGITRELDHGSVRLKGAGTFTILSVSSRINYGIDEQPKTEPESIVALRSRVNEINSEMALLRVSTESLAAEEKYVSVVSESPSREDRPLAELIGIADFVRDRLPDIKRRKLDVEASLVALNKESQQIRLQLNEYSNSGQQKATAEVVATVSTEQAVRGEFDLTYRVGSATWKTHYDLRSPSVSEPLEITHYADIAQSTGESWIDVSVTLSTGDPQLRNVLPELTPLRLPNPQVFAKRRQSESAEEMDELVIEAERPIVQKETAGIGGSARQASSAIDVTASERRTVTEYAIGPRVSITDDRKPRTFEIRQITADASFDYLAVPKQDPTAYVTAHVADWSQYDLGSGEMSLFVDEVFIGKTYLDTDTVTDTLSLPLGQDQSVSVKREKRRQFGKRNFLGSKTEVALGFTITIRNNREEPITMIVRDQIPISLDKSIEVRPGDLADAKHNKDTGELEWLMDLKQGESRDIQFDYSVKYPRGMSLRLE